jgi:putative DNA primase/helicase
VSLTPEHRQYLRDSAITDEIMDASGIESTPSGIVFPWKDGTGAVVRQQRPDAPRLDDEGRPIKYVFPKGAKVPFNKLRDPEGSERMILAEGTKQHHAVASYAPADMAVYGMSGCWGYRNADLAVAEGRQVFVLMDADLETNLDVWTAASDLTKQLKRHGATDVRYVFTTGTGKQGVDDVLAAIPAERRPDNLRRWLEQAESKLPRKPRAKRPKASDVDEAAAKYFGTRDKPLVFKPYDYAVDVMAEFPSALTPEGTISLYRDGVYSVDANALLSVIVPRLGNYYSASYLTQVRDIMTGILAANDRVLPELSAEPLLNCRNGMVDLRTGALRPHSPEHMSFIQVTQDYDPTMKTPVYDAWLRSSLRQDGMTEDELSRLVQDLEESASAMLNPSLKDKKSVFLYGASRTGKSTFLRLMNAIAGPRNTSAVTLHDLGSDSFATANLYGKMLNTAADLSNRHVEDLSKFKMATGADELHANRKYGQQFTFTNRAMFAFSANELPTVSEASKAYSARIKPFHFPNSFLGREDETLEGRLMDELPGILARWVRAHMSFLKRGGYLATEAATQADFEAKSDRVVQFFQDMCTLTEADHGAALPESMAAGRRDVATAFNGWAERNGGSKMGERAFFQRFSKISGVVEVKLGPKARRGFNVTVAPADEDVWGPDEATEADPVQPSGVVPARDMQGDPWTAAEQPATPCPVPSVKPSLNEAQMAVQGFSTGEAPDPFWPEGEPFPFQI